MRRNHLFCVVAIVAMANLFAACGPDTVVQVLPVERTIYVCADNSQVTDAAQCPPVAPVVETRTEYVCRGGTVVASVEQCPNWTVTCPPGTEPYMDEARHDDGCTYVATCHEGYAYDTATSTCKRIACPPGQTINAGGDDCVTVEPTVVTETVTIYVCADGSEVSMVEDCPPPIFNACAADMDCAAGERCNTADLCVIPCHRDGDCHNSGLWCGLPAIKEDNTLGTCQLVQNSVITISPDGAMPAAAIVLGGSTNVPVAVFDFDVTRENALIHAFNIRNCVGMRPSRDDDCNQQDEIQGTDAVIVDIHLKYTDRLGNEVTKTSFFQNGTAEFSGLNFQVEAGVRANMTVTVDTNTISSMYGVFSGTRFQMNLIATMFDAVGTASGRLLTVENGGAVFTATGNRQAVANPMTIHITKPTVTLASGSPSGAAYQGFSEVLRFNVTADAAGYIGLKMIKFRLMSMDYAGTAWNTIRGGSRTVWLAAADFKMYNAMNPSEEIPSVVWLLNAAGGVAGEGDIVAQIAFYFDPHAIPIAAGMTRTFVLKMNTSGASSSHDDVVRTDITDIGWSDAGLSETIDGSLIKHLPVIGGTLIF